MNPQNQHIYNSIDLLLSKNASFALYRLPNETSIHLVLQNKQSPDILPDPQLLTGKKGFVIAPFDISPQSPVLLIRPDVLLTGEDNISEYLENNIYSLPVNLRTDSYSPTDSGALERYEGKFRLFHQELEQGRIQKLVLSRTFDIERKQDFSAGEIFQRACDKYPSNFIFLCNTPISGIWFGCSPESLLSGENNQWKTDALAGTQDISTAKNDILWDDKNQLEQNIVVEYMKSQLSKAGLEAECGEAKTVRSGNLIHLRSELRFRTGDGFDIGKTLFLLHPSPAVCGFPKEEAFRFILDNEEYDRAYYSGFLGYMDTDTKTDLFVNLRCMRVFENKLRLFAGGGILTSSELMPEWEETEGKLQTILSIL